MQRPSFLTLTLALAVPAFLAAQTPRGLREVREHSVMDLGFGAIAGTAVGAFSGQTQPTLWGGNADLVVNLGRHVGLRMEGAYVQYGHENYLLTSGGGFYGYDVNTDFFISSFRMGPQITLGTGPVRLFVYGTAGGAYFGTRTSPDGYGCACGTTYYDDATLSLAGGGGLRFDLGRGRHAVGFVIGGSYVHNDLVSYLRPGDIVTGPNGAQTLYPVQSTVDYATLDVGLKFGLF
jgi:hypothetical protein